MIMGRKGLFWLLWVLWLLLNIGQSLYTELGRDEAYYWVFSQNLAWGYLAHPPMVAWFIKLGGLILPGTLGVRLLTVISQSAVLLMLASVLRDHLQSRRAVVSFYLLAASMPMFVAYGFITTPDVPLLFFTTAFILCWRRYLQSEGWSIVFPMALTMAGMVYSKYYGAIMILLLVSARPRALVDRRFLSSVLLSLLLFSPHLYWLYDTDFIALKARLEVNVARFEWRYLYEYPLNQMAVFNPLLLLLGFMTACRLSTTDVLERSLKIMALGVFTLFGLSAFRGHVEPHWTTSIAVCFILLLTPAVGSGRYSSPWIRNTLIAFAAIIMIVRVFLIVDILPISTEWHGNKKRLLALHEQAGDTPIVFTNSYQLASLYRFYTASNSFSLSVDEGGYYRWSDYNLWRFDQAAQGQHVLLNCGADHYDIEVKGEYETLYFRRVDHFQSLEKLQLTTPTTAMSVTAGQEIEIDVALYNPYSTPLLNDSTHPIAIYPIWLNGSQRICNDRATISGSSTTLGSEASNIWRLRFRAPTEIGHYELVLGCQMPYYPPFRNSVNRITVVVTTPL